MFSPSQEQAVRKGGPFSLDGDSYSAGFSEESETLALPEYDEPPMRPWYLTRDERTDEKEVRKWPGIAHAGANAANAGVPEYVGEYTQVRYPGTDRSELRKVFPSSWVVWLDRRHFDAADWDRTESDVRGCNQFATNVGDAKLPFFDRHWKRIVWAKMITKKPGARCGWALSDPNQATHRQTPCHGHCGYQGWIQGKWIQKRVVFGAECV